MSPPKELWKSFIDAHPDLEQLESGKVRCKITGHEMAPTKEVVEVKHDPTLLAMPPDRKFCFLHVVNGLRYQ